jgi:antitoxin component YwqK of YwqJK toxin-antitoxin module
MRSSCVERVTSLLTCLCNTLYSFLLLDMLVIVMDLPLDILYIDIPININDSSTFHSYINALLCKDRTGRKITIDKAIIEAKKRQFTKKIELHTKSIKEVIHALPNGLFHGDYMQYIIQAFEDNDIDPSIISFRDKYVLRTKKTYVDGTKQGKGFYYYPNGKVKVEFTYIDGGKEGEYKTYFNVNSDSSDTFATHGKLRSIGIYKNNVRDGLMTSYYSNGNIETITSYKDGKTHGRFIRYAMNKERAYILAYENGWQYGLEWVYEHDNLVCVKYNDPTCINDPIVISDDFINSDSITFFDKRTLRGEKRCVTDLFKQYIECRLKKLYKPINTISKKQDQSTDIRKVIKTFDIEEIHFHIKQDGTLHGLYQSYILLRSKLKEDIIIKALKRECTYVDGKRHGIVYKYKLTNVDNIINEWGGDINHPDYNDETKSLFHRSDIVTVSFQCKHGVKDGPYNSYNLTIKNDLALVSNVYQTYTYKNGELDGDYMTYNDNKVIEKHHFVDGKKDGESRLIYDSFKSNISVNYVNDKKEGDTIIYDTGNKPIRRIVYKNNNKAKTYHVQW